MCFVYLEILTMVINFEEIFQFNIVQKLGKLKQKIDANIWDKITKAKKKAFQQKVSFFVYSMYLNTRNKQG